MARVSEQAVEEKGPVSRTQKDGLERAAWTSGAFRNQGSEVYDILQSKAQVLRGTGDFRKGQSGGSAG